LIIDRSSGIAAVIDPAAPDVVVDVANRLGARIAYVLCTHGHHDHAGGNMAIKNRFPNILVAGGSSSTVAGVTMVVKNHDKLWIGKTPVYVIATPCHTTDHVVYAVGGEEVDAPEASSTFLSSAQAVFTGDTLFIGGVGALFHGSSRDLMTALNGLSLLPDSCQVFCGHEYAEQLLWFAAWVEPENSQVLRRAHWASIQRSFLQSTVPSTMGWERQTNPWLRHQDPYLVTAVELRYQAYNTIPWWRRQWMKPVPKSWTQPLRVQSHNRHEVLLFACIK